MRAWPVLPGAPAAGHVTARGWWHPGAIDGCVKCPAPAPTRCLVPGCGELVEGDLFCSDHGWGDFARGGPGDG